MNGLPILSVITWAPFVRALVIMLFARHRPQLVRWTAAAGAAVSFVRRCGSTGRTTARRPDFSSASSSRSSRRSASRI